MTTIATNQSVAAAPTSVSTPPVPINAVPPRADLVDDPAVATVTPEEELAIDEPAGLVDEAAPRSRGMAALAFASQGV
ncbi:MAG: hypothetical protein AAF596_00665, partial [Planctomycetota bacterium]